MAANKSLLVDANKSLLMAANIPMEIDFAAPATLVAAQKNYCSC